MSPSSFPAANSHNPHHHRDDLSVTSIDWSSVVHRVEGIEVVLRRLVVEDTVRPRLDEDPRHVVSLEPSVVVIKTLTAHDPTLDLAHLAAADHALTRRGHVRDLRRPDVEVVQITGDAIARHLRLERLLEEEGGGDHRATAVIAATVGVVAEAEIAEDEALRIWPTQTIWNWYLGHFAKSACIFSQVTRSLEKSWSKVKSVMGGLDSGQRSMSFTCYTCSLKPTKRSSSSSGK